ncbi:MAG: hypothetical protein DRG83_10945, partial [Deltaproteobacteria bacterium]
MSNKKKKVLIVDDQQDYLRSLASVLGTEFEIQTASSLAEFKRLRLDELSLVLLDIRLDDSDPSNREGMD